MGLWQSYSPWCTRSGRPTLGSMELEVRHLRALCAIADTGSLHRAARTLGNPDLKLQTLVIAASYIALAVRAERTERDKESDKAKRCR